MRALTFFCVNQLIIYRRNSELANLMASSENHLYEKYRPSSVIIVSKSAKLFPAKAGPTTYSHSVHQEVRQQWDNALHALVFKLGLKDLYDHHIAEMRKIAPLFRGRLRLLPSTHPERHSRIHLGHLARRANERAYEAYEWQAEFYSKQHLVVDCEIDYSRDTQWHQNAKRRSMNPLEEFVLWRWKEMDHLHPFMAIRDGFDR